MENIDHNPKNSVASLVSTTLYLLNKNGKKRILVQQAK